MICIFLLSLTKKIKMKNLFLCLLLLSSTFAFSNNVLVQNVTTTGNNATNNTIQVQFDLSWDNSWRDAINWDAAWVFMKFKNASGVWQHVQLNTTGFTNGTGTANTVQVTADKVGAWVYRSALGSGTFSSTTMQLQWNYGLSGLTSVAGLEVRVYAVEMVYIPQGDFVCPRSTFIITGTEADLQGRNNLIVNNRLSPSFTGPYSLSKRINGNVGIDTDNNGIIDNTTFPTGYKPFFIFKYEVTEQQYSDFLNTLSTLQINTLGIPQQWYSSITLNNGQYFSSNPIKRFVEFNNYDLILFSFADWSAVRPMSDLEFYKANFGPLLPYQGETSTPNIITNVLANNSIYNYIATYYGVNDAYTSNVLNEWSIQADDPIVLIYNQFFSNINGNGIIQPNGLHDVSSWNNLDVGSGAIGFGGVGIGSGYRSFRYVRSAE
jgi:hypothetical protein